MYTIDVPAGTVFGRLTVIGETRTPSGKRMILCRCECGQQKAIASGHLRQGRTKSCGCLLRQITSGADPANKGQIPLHGKKARGRVAFIDEEDWELVSRHRWQLHEMPQRLGLRTNGPYAKTHTYQDGRRVGLAMHVLIMGQVGVDHIDGNGLNNRRSNLRPATISQNGANRRKQAGTSSVFKGVCWNKRRKKWSATIRYDGKTRSLGYFVNEEDAARAYDAAALATWGEYARPNFTPPLP